MSCHGAAVVFCASQKFFQTVILNLLSGTSWIFIYLTFVSVMVYLSIHDSCGLVLVRVYLKISFSRERHPLISSSTSRIGVCWLVKSAGMVYMLGCPVT